MKKVFLPDVCRIQYGYPFDSTLFNDKEGTPLIRIRDIIRGYSETYTTEKVNEGFLVHPGDILIGMDGEFNVAKWGSIPSYLNQRVCRIFPQKNIDSEYLFHYLPVALKKIEEKTPFVAVKHLSAKALSTIPVPICELSEQRRKSQFLSSICFLVELRKKQLSLLGQLASSRFIELFGDPIKNPRKWNFKTLLELGHCKNGLNFHNGETGFRINCLGVGDFQNHSVIDRTDNLPFISVAEYPPKDYLLQDGDIVFVRSNGNKALVGRCLIVYPHDNQTTYSGFCIRFRQDSNDINTNFLLFVLKSDAIRRKMVGRGANIQNLNQQILASLPIPVPPLALQNEFASFIEELDKSKLIVQNAGKCLKKIFEAVHYKRGFISDEQIRGDI